MQLVMAGGSHLSLLKNWCAANAPGYVFPADMKTVAARAQALNQHWTNIETCFGKVESGEWGVSASKDRPNDFDVIVPQGATAPMTSYPAPHLMGLGVLPLIPIIIIVGRILLAAIIAFITWVIADAITQDSENKLAAVKVDSDMAKADPSTRAAYEQFKQSGPFKDSKSVWDSLRESAMGLGVIALIGLAIMAFTKAGSRKSETAA